MVKSDCNADVAWCAADPHLGPGDEVLGVFLDWLGAFERSGTPTLVLLGDLFQAWIGLSDTQSGEQRMVLDTLGRLSAGGRKVVYLVGNRDYFVEESVKGTKILVSGYWNLAAGARKIHFEHGDLINSSDNNYLRWRTFSRSGAVRALVGVLSPTWRRRLARRMEASLAGTNRAYKNYEPSEELGTWAEGLSKAGFNAAVVGHFHRDEVREAGGITVRFLPRFREEGFHLRIDGEGEMRLVPHEPGR